MNSSILGTGEMGFLREIVLVLCRTFSFFVDLVLCYPLIFFATHHSRSMVSNSFATAWTVACQAPLSMGFLRQEYWGGLPFTPPGDLPDPETELRSPALASGFFTTEPPRKPRVLNYVHTYL